ncbi:hypothetical protein ABKN59_008986 [Abortiporus biennis]
MATVTQTPQHQRIRPDYLGNGWSIGLDRASGLFGPSNLYFWYSDPLHLNGPQVSKIFCRWNRASFQVTMLSWFQSSCTASSTKWTSDHFLSKRSSSETTPQSRSSGPCGVNIWLSIHFECICPWFFTTIIVFCS